MAAPSEFVTQQETLRNAFREVGVRRGNPPASADALYSLLPPSLAATTAIKLLLGTDWQYQFGRPFTNLGTTAAFFGSHEVPSVDVLYQSIEAIERFVPDTATRSTLYQRLDDIDKHAERIAEIAPLLHVAPYTTASYELPGSGANNYLIDWDLQRPECVTTLVEVKKRWDSIDHFKEIIPAIERGETAIDPTPPDPTKLFKSTVVKFKPVDPTIRLQGVWLDVELKYDYAPVEAAFRALDPTRAHFLIVGHGSSIAATVFVSPQVEALVRCLMPKI